MSPASIAFVNNAMETFTPTTSGALATHIHECCRVAKDDGAQPLVITRSSTAEPFAWSNTRFVGEVADQDSGVVSRARRVARRTLGWGDPGEFAYARACRRILADQPRPPAAVICQNNPGLASHLASCLPMTMVIHHFQNQLQMPPAVLRRYRRAELLTTAVSSFTAGWLRQQYGVECTTVVPNGVDDVQFNPGKRRRHAGPVLLGFAGRTGREKAPDLLLRAAVLLASQGYTFEVQVAGSNHWGRFTDDDYQRHLRVLIGDLLHRGIVVRTLGHVTRAGMPEAFADVDVHVTTSRWDEPFGMVTLEAMASGCAVVATATGGTTEIVADAGLLVPRDDPESLAGVLGALIDDEALRGEVAARCLARAGGYSWDTVWQSWKTLVEGHRARPQWAKEDRVSP